MQRNKRSLHTVVCTWSARCRHSIDTGRKVNRCDRSEKNRSFAWCDLAALVFGIALAAYFLLTVRDSVGEPDEAAYYLLGHRLATGARMISDEWHLTQFGFLPVVPLYFLYTHFAGGTQGIVLFMRYAFIFADLAYYIYMYI